MARIGVVVGGHLNARVPELGAASVDAALLHNGITEELAQFVHFLPCEDPIPIQPSLQGVPMELAPVARVECPIPPPGGVDDEQTIRARFESHELRNHGRVDVNRTAAVCFG